MGFSTTEQFIEKAKLKHGDKYDYSKVEYVNKISKIKIICSEHDVFEQRPDSHLIGSGCQKCSGLFMDTNYFIEKAQLVHGDKYDYSLVDYINSTTNVKIICKLHGEFITTPNNHLRGSNCSNCSGNLVTKLTTNDFILKAQSVHGDRYDYSLVDYVNYKTKVKIICPKHGEFNQQPNNHITSKRGCSKCGLSHGERAINDYLTTNKIIFINNHKFPDCKYKKELPFDFYLPDYNTCIEFDGEQHYQIVEYFGGVSKFILQQERDKIKTDYCVNNNIPLIRINDINKIECELNKICLK